MASEDGECNGRGMVRFKAFTTKDTKLHEGKPMGQSVATLQAFRGW
jgi:hypothetical protein